MLGRLVMGEPMGAVQSGLPPATISRSYWPGSAWMYVVTVGKARVRVPASPTRAARMGPVQFVEPWLARQKSRPAPVESGDQLARRRLVTGAAASVPPSAAE